VRVRLDLVGSAGSKPDKIEHFADSFPAYATVESADDFEISVGGEIRIEVGLLDDSTDRLESFLTLLLERFPEEKNLPFRGPYQGEEHPDSCALAGSIWTEKAEHVAPMDLEVEMMYSPSALVLLAKVLGL
jgi:hypothetical protein